MKVLTTTGLTKLIQLIKSSFISTTDTVTTNTVTLATVATSGDYDDLINKPSSVTVDQTYDGTSTNAQSGVAIAGAGFLTGITSSDITTALGYTPYDSTNPNGYTTNTGTVTSVNNVSPVSGNVTLSIPTNTSDLTNDSGYITGITSSDVTTALGYTPYNSTNPNGYTSNVGTVTSVNNTSPDANGDVTISIPSISGLADTNLSNLSATGKAVIDGQWIASFQTIHNGSISNGTTDLPYTVNVPNDGRKYEVLLSGRVVTGTTSGQYATLDVSSSVCEVWICSARTRTASSVFSNGMTILPLGTDRIVNVKRNSTNWAGGEATLSMVAYRRIGTNS